MRDAVPNLHVVFKLIKGLQTQIRLGDTTKIELQLLEVSKFSHKHEQLFRQTQASKAIVITFAF